MASQLRIATAPIHIDEALIAVDKPAGLLAVPGRGANKQDCLWLRLRDTHPEALVVHRLDMATSGLMLFARTPAAQRALGHDFAARRVDKEYVAIVAGQVEADSGTIDLPIGADWPRRPRQRVDRVGGREATTRWQVLERLAGGTRLRLQPLTGRTHQLRLHLAAIGHAILGDTLYAPPEVQARADRLMLHACGLELPHPSGAGRLALHCAAPF